MDLVYSANRIAELIDEIKPDSVAIDGGGVGGGVVDILKDRGYRVVEVQFGAKADDDRYGNKRTEIWGRMRDWLGEGCIENEGRLMDDLSAPEYGFASSTSDKLMLESKEKMKSRGYHSPDDADALALTFAVRVSRTDTRTSRSGGRRNRVAEGMDYSVLG
jgi:hypothetical protein